MIPGEDLHEILKRVRRSDRWGETGQGVKTQAQQRYATGIVMTDARCLWRKRCDLMSGVVRLTVRGKVCVSQGGWDKGLAPGRPLYWLMRERGV